MYNTSILSNYTNYESCNKTQFNNEKKIDPIAIIDLYRDINRQKILKEFVISKNLNPLYIYLYTDKDDRPEKNMMDEEICYDAVSNLYNKLEIAMCNIWGDEPNVKIIFIGDYKEYNYVVELISYVFNNKKIQYKNLGVNISNKKSLYSCFG